MIYRIANKSDWELARQNGYFASEDLNNEGFIHCSTLLQVTKVANRIYQGQPDLHLLEIDEAKLTAPLKWENTHSNGELFPHIYGCINLDAIARTFDFPANVSGFELPSQINLK